MRIFFHLPFQGRNFLLLSIQNVVVLLIVLITLNLHCSLLPVVSAVPNPISGPRLSAVLPPPQVLLPPHREEGQSLDDIIYGTSFSGSLLSRFDLATKSPVEVPRPNLFSTSSPPPPPPPFRPSHNINNIFNIPVPPPNSRAFNHGPNNNVNLVQTFTPPSPPPPPVPRLASSSSSISTSSSAEEIKVPQPVKHRFPNRKYTKSDLIAAANSIKPAGFDFNKVLIVTPSNNNLNSSNNANANGVSPIYQQVMFPLPLFDTPVYNQLRPFMEMLMKARYNLGAGSVSDNKKVLVIIPKSNGRIGNNLPSGRSATHGANHINPLLNNNSKQHLLQSSATTTTSSTKSSPTSSKFATLPKASSAKHLTTPKPKQQFSQGFSTTKRATATAAKVTGKKSVKGPDLQASATSSKFSHRPGANNPSSAASSDKRSYSSKGGDNYSFSYSVKNDEYKDVKSHSESRDGDTVAGEYSMLEADGYTRIVRYTVDSDQGFKASVKRIPPSS